VHPVRVVFEGGSVDQRPARFDHSRHPAQQLSNVPMVADNQS